MTGDETHSVTVTLPQGTTLMENGVALTPTTAGGSTYTLAPSQFSGLTVAVPNGYDGSLAVTVTAPPRTAAASPPRPRVVHRLLRMRGASVLFAAAHQRPARLLREPHRDARRCLPAALRRALCSSRTAQAGEHAGRRRTVLES